MVSLTTQKNRCMQPRKPVATTSEIWCLLGDQSQNSVADNSKTRCEDPWRHTTSYPPRTLKELHKYVADTFKNVATTLQKFREYSQDPLRYPKTSSRTLKTCWYYIGFWRYKRIPKTRRVYL